MEEEKVSSLLRYWRYFRVKSRNAFWRLKTNGLKNVWVSLVNEINGWRNRRQAQQTMLKVEASELSPSPSPAEEKIVPGSAYVNKRKLIPPSTRPIHSKMFPAQPLKADRAELRVALKNILESLPTLVDENNE